MQQTFLFIAAYFIVEIYYIATMCRVLPMRSNAVYALITLAAYTLNYFFIGSDASLTIRGLCFGLPHSILLPIVCSTGPLKKRLARVALIDLAVLAIDFVALVLFAPALMRMLPQQALSSNGVDITSVYVLSAPILIPFFEAYVMICRQIDRREQESSIGTEIIAACLLAYVPVCLFDLSLYANNLQNVVLATVGALCTVLSMLFCLATLWAAEREARLAREQADHAARLRQEHHLKSVIDSTTRRASAVHHLRHDLANQIEVVEELAEQGRIRDAQDYLVALRRQAQSISIGQQNRSE